MKKESRHATKLRELGFESFSSEEQSYSDRRTIQKIAGLATVTGTNLDPNSLNRKQRRQLNKIMSKPWFIFHEGESGGTHAYDENAKGWKSTQKIDLTPLGFEDRTSLR